MIYEKPLFSSPKRFATGTLTLSNAISPVSDAFQPNLFSLVADTPAISLSKTNILMPLFPSSGVVFAVTIK